jgi:hypothetical protein
MQGNTFFSVMPRTVQYAKYSKTKGQQCHFLLLYGPSVSPTIGLHPLPYLRNKVSPTTYSKPYRVFNKSVYTFINGHSSVISSPIQLKRFESVSQVILHLLVCLNTT